MLASARPASVPLVLPFYLVLSSLRQLCADYCSFAVLAAIATADPDSATGSCLTNGCGFVGEKGVEVHAICVLVADVDRNQGERRRVEKEERMREEGQALQQSRRTSS